MPEIFRKIINGQSLLAIWKIRETPDELMEMIHLREQEKKLFSTFLVERRKKQWLAYRILIRSMLEPENFPVEYDASGKPYLAGSRYHISVTHSGDLAAVILSSAGLVGIDIEKVRPTILKVAEKYLHESELTGTGGRDDSTFLTLAWCAKEALYKLYGHRGLDFKENIRLQFTGSGPYSEFQGEIRTAAQCHSYQLVSKQFEDYILVYVTEERG
jgi:phosphopantetheinyl transferase